MAVRTIPRRGERLWRGEEALLPRLRTLAYADPGKRDLRLDFLRGLAVAIMVVDHMGGDTPLTRLSGANQFIVSAAEAFVFLSGLVLGMVYGDRFAKDGPRTAIKALLLRAFTLYKASVGVALSFLALFLFTNLRLWLDRSSGLGTTSPLEAISGIFTLHFSFHGSDVLVMYTLMIAASPLILFLLFKGRTPQTLLASFALWAAFQRFPEVASFPWRVLGSSFPVAAWQLLLVLGLVVGFHRARVSRFLLAGSTASRLLVFAAGSLVYLLAWSYARLGSLHLPSPWFADATYSSLFLKESLGPGRLLAFLSVAILAYTLVNALWAPLSHTLGWFLLPLGQNSLYVYIMQLFVMAFLFNTTPPVLTWTAGWVDIDLLNLGAQLLALASLWAMVRGHFLFALVPR